MVMIDQLRILRNTRRPNVVRHGNVKFIQTVLQHNIWIFGIILPKLKT